MSHTSPLCEKSSLELPLRFNTRGRFSVNLLQHQTFHIQNSVEIKLISDLTEIFDPTLSKTALQPL